MVFGPTANYALWAAPIPQHVASALCGPPVGFSASESFVDFESLKSILKASYLACKSWKNTPSYCKQNTISRDLSLSPCFFWVPSRSTCSIGIPVSRPDDAEAPAGSSELSSLDHCEGHRLPKSCRLEDFGRPAPLMPRTFSCFPFCVPRKPPGKNNHRLKKRTHLSKS